MGEPIQVGEAAVTPWRRSRVGWSLFAGMGLLVLGFLVASGLRSTAAPLPILGTLAPFRFINQEGAPWGTEELKGHVYVADFIFTRCPAICPRMTERMGELQRRLGAAKSPVRLVSMSVDPVFDTPARLKAYAAAHHADPRSWTFLTGEIHALESTITQGFKVSVTREAPGDFMGIVHGAYYVLVDGRGRVRGYYDSNDPQSQPQLLADAGRLTRESP